MSKPEHVICYQVAMTPENAPVIDQINKLLLGGDYSKVAPKSTEKPSKGTFSDPVNTDSQPTFDDLKAVAKQLRVKMGLDEADEFGLETLKRMGIKCGTSFMRSLSKVDKEDYPAVIAKLKAGPQTASNDLIDELDDGLEDDLDDDLGDDVPSVEAVQTALKAFAKSNSREEAKKIMSDNGAKSLSDVENCTPAQLIKMFAKLT